MLIVFKGYHLRLKENKLKKKSNILSGFMRIHQTMKMYPLKYTYNNGPGCTFNILNS